MNYYINPVIHSIVCIMCLETDCTVEFWKCAKRWQRFSRLVQFLFSWCPIIAPLSAREHSNKYFNNQAHIRDNGRQKKIKDCSWHNTDLLWLPRCYCSFFISCSLLACPLWRVVPHKGGLVLSVQLNTVVVTLSCCSFFTKDTHDRVSFVFWK